MVYEVVHCSECGKPIKSAPSWMADVAVRFSCDTCRQKHPRPFVGLDTPSPAAIRGVDDEDEVEGVDGEETTSLDELLEEEMAGEEAAIEKAPED